MKWKNFMSDIQIMIFRYITIMHSIIEIKYMEVKGRFQIPENASYALILATYLRRVDRDSEMR